MSQGSSSKRDEWLTSILGVDCYSVSSPDGTPRTPGFCYAKIPVSDIKNLKEFQGQGFAIIDTAVTFSRQVKKEAKSKYSRLATPADRKQIVELAYNAFSTSRFHLDPEISREKANELKASWAENFFEGKRGSAMVVAEVDGKVCGFLQLLGTETDTVVIDLIAVDKEQRGKGLASDMVSFTESHFKKPSKIVVGTQVSNSQSIRLWEKNGFMFSHAVYVAHRHSK
jgi:dTDP-4-amino-4,6-dideoxy-D-galactose acyltransferase